MIAEGAGAVVLEDWDRAVTRGATIYGEVLGYGASNDAHHLAQPDPDGVGIGSMMRAALQNAGVAPEQIGYLNAHGTGHTRRSRRAKAIKRSSASAHHVPVSSTKSMIGHSFGAAGAIGAIFCLLAIREGMLPPTINYRVPDPECDLDYIPNEARPEARGRALERHGTRWPQRLPGARARMNTAVQTRCSTSANSVTGSTICQISTQATSARSPSGSIINTYGRSTASQKRSSSSSRGASSSSGANRSARRPTRRR